MTLTALGFNDFFAGHAAAGIAQGFTPGRVISEHREQYQVLTDSGEYSAEITGNLRFSAQGREAFPAAGDWVMLSLYEGGFAVIHSVLPRLSIIKRRSVSLQSDIQIIACNIDCAFILQAADRDFNLNRLERYLTICNDSNIESVIVITKTDLYPQTEIQELKSRVESRVKNSTVILLSSETPAGIDQLKSRIEKGRTYCLLGSSGVGKSTLINKLLESSVLKTDKLSSLTGKGRHTTSFRQLFILPEGGIIIDNPGMREVGLADIDSGLDKTFDEISALSNGCRYSDCTHLNEAGCAVLEAVSQKQLDKKLYDNYIRLKKENEFFSSTKAEKRKKDKDFGKMVKKYIKEKNSKKF